MNKLFIACVVASLFVACSKKDILKWINKPGNPKPSVPCRIDSIYPVYKDPDPVISSGWSALGIHYNDKGNPAFINYNFATPNRMGEGPVIYRYDSKNRLVEVDPPNLDPVDLMYDIPGIILRHKFVYQGNAQLPMRDSILSDTFFGVWEGVAYKVYTVRVEDLYYDAQGRIIRTVARGLFNNTRFDLEVFADREAKYSYDSKGNRQVINDGYGNTPPTVSYTNKPSLYSLHPVWQLVHKNWSKNAAQMNVQTYNSNGLPTRVDLTNEYFLKRWYADINNPFFIINYTCM